MTRSTRHPGLFGAVIRALVVVAFCAAPAGAQDTGTVSGTVVDTSGQVVPGATVTLTNDATADSRATASSSTGTFTFRAVPPGSYSVRIELQGFRSFEQKKNIVNASGHGFSSDCGRNQRGSSSPSS